MTNRPPKVSTYVDFGPPGMPDAPIGTIYVDKHTNKIWMLNSQRKWVQMLTFADFGIDYTEAVEIFSNNKKIATLYSTEHKEKVKLLQINKNIHIQRCLLFGFISNL